MTDEEKQIVPQIILNDLKYLSVRSLYLDWFFPTGAEVADQLIDNIIKIYLRSVQRQDLVTEIRNWRGNETHNIVRIIKLLVDKLSIDYQMDVHEDVLTNLYRIYRGRYFDINNVEASKTLLKDLDTIDYTYKYFRDKVNISDKAMEETPINKIFLKNQDLAWGVGKISLSNIFYIGNKHFKK